MSLFTTTLPVLPVNVSFLHAPISMVLNVTRYEFSPTDMNTIYLPKLSSMSFVLLKTSNGNNVNIRYSAMVVFVVLERFLAASLSFDSKV